MDIWEDIRKRKNNRGNEYGHHSFHSYMEIHNEASDFVQLLHANNKIHNFISNILLP